MSSPVQDLKYRYLQEKAISVYNSCETDEQREVAVRMIKRTIAKFNRDIGLQMTSKGMHNRPLRYTYVLHLICQREGSKGNAEAYKRPTTGLFSLGNCYTNPSFEVNHV
jgi:hypothetical protein